MIETFAYFYFLFRIQEF